MDSAILDLVLGVLFIFLVFSLIVSALNEAITRLLAWRSRHLWASLRELLDGKPTSLGTDQRPLKGEGDNSTWTDQLYAHPLIRQLEGRTVTARSRLSRIPTTDFARSLIDLISEGGTSVTVDDLRAKVDALPVNSALKAPLTAIIREAGDRLDDFRKAIGDWFEARMEALSATYKRHAKYVLVVIGLVVAVALNVDAIDATQRLYRDDALRTAVANQATDLVSKCAEEQDAAECARTEVEKIDPAIRLPVGWGDPNPIDLLQVLGWLIAGIALGQGAPFWFDVLRKASRLRR